MRADQSCVANWKAGHACDYTRPFLPACAFAPNVSMQALLEFAPLVAFLIAYYAGGLYGHGCPDGRDGFYSWPWIMCACGAFRACTR